MNYFLVSLSLIFGNFIYQCLFSDIPDYGVALDRSFFQCVAVFCCWCSQNV